MIAAFRKTPGWVTVPAVGLLLAVGAATLTSAVTVVAADAGAAVVNTPTMVAVPMMNPMGGPANVTAVNGGAAEVTFTVSRVPEARPKELDVVVTAISVDGQSLEKVLSFLADTTHMNLAVNWQAVEGLGVDKNAPVTVNLKNVPLHKVLDVVLSQVNQGLGYEFSDNVLTISQSGMLPQNAAPRAMENIVRVYNVRDLVEKAAADASTAPPGAAPQVDATTALDNETAKLQGLIMSTVEPQSWANTGGSAGSMQSFHGLITVTAAQGVQERVAALLEDLRKADKEGVKK